MSDIQETYSKGYEDGQNAVLRLVKHILDDAPKSGYNGSVSYYKISIKMLLEVYEYGKEKKDTKQEKTTSAASKS